MGTIYHQYNLQRRVKRKPACREDLNLIGQSKRCGVFSLVNPANHQQTPFRSRTGPSAWHAAGEALSAKINTTAQDCTFGSSVSCGTSTIWLSSVLLPNLDFNPHVIVGRIRPMADRRDCTIDKDISQFEMVYDDAVFEGKKEIPDGLSVLFHTGNVGPFQSGRRNLR
jgi:hypothetical protein